MSSLALVAGREVRQTLRRRSFWVITVILFMASLAAVIVPSVIESNRERVVVAVAGAPDGIEASLRPMLAADDTDLTFENGLDAAEIRAAVDDGRVDVGLIGGSTPSILVLAGEHEGLVGRVQQALVTSEQRRRLLAAGLSDEAVTSVLHVQPGTVEGLRSDDAARRAAAAVAATVLYLLLFGLTMQVANGVAIEKANRISEVLLAIVPPSPLLFGKVLGLGLTALAGFAIGASPIVASAAFGDGLPAGMGAALAGGAAWLVLGLALYLVVAGALGALVERPEQAGSVMSPIMVVLIGSLVVGQSAPDSTFAAVLAYIPFSSPVVEPARIAVDASSPLEMAISLVALLVAVVLAVRIGAVIYRRAIVRTGRVTVRQVLRAA